MMNMKKFITISLLLLFSLPTIAFSWGTKEPTAIIVDNETGQPIEGAAAVAQWIGHSSIKRAWWEGGTDYLIKAKESLSDKDGKVHIDGFWGTYVLSRKPRLTVYKPGYAVWDSEIKFSGGVRNPAEYNETQRTIRLNKFEKEAAMLLKSAPKLKYPHDQHDSFLNTLCLSSAISDIYAPGTIKIGDIFDEYEQPFIKKERVQRAKDDENEKINNRR